MSLFRIVCGALIIAGTPFVSYAQFQDASGSIQLSQQFPEPNTTITAELTGRITQDLTWQVNGSDVTNSRGQRSIEVPVGGLGERTTIRAISRGEVVDETHVFPIYVDIAIEAFTHAPDHYTGRRLPSAGSQVRLTAMVEEEVVRDPSRYQYQWRIDGSTIGGGVTNDHQIETRLPNRRDVVVTVTVIRPGVGAIGQQAIRVPLSEPEVEFYRLHSLYGLQPYALGQEVDLTQSEISIQAAPYNLPQEIIQEPGTIEWRIGSQSTNQNTENPLTIQLQSQQITGQALLQFDVLSLGAVLQSIAGQLRINY